MTTITLAGPNSAVIIAILLVVLVVPRRATRLLLPIA
ncbi:hypothetical protein DC74_6135 [Streptomyces noursei]|nr:hypothetical protein DC74_6135 [Streptomyces noursei]